MDNLPYLHASIPPALPKTRLRILNSSGQIFKFFLYERYHNQTQKLVVRSPLKLKIIGIV
jgi:hypothetical protein